MARAFEIVSRDLIAAASMALTLATLLPQALTPTPAQSAASTGSTGPPLQPIDGHTPSSLGVGIQNIEGATLICRAAGRLEGAVFPWHEPKSRGS